MHYNQTDKNITSPTSPKSRLSDQLRECLHYQHYSFVPEKPCVWAGHLHTLATKKNHQNGS